jgi:hypothetical protein
MIDTSKIIPCVLCGSRFSEMDVHQGRFFASTGVCLDCYRAQVLQSTRVSCFGKKGKRTAFNKRSVECARLCPDRIICALFVSGDLQ